MIDFPDYAFSDLWGHIEPAMDAAVTLWTPYFAKTGLLWVPVVTVCIGVTLWVVNKVWR